MAKNKKRQIKLLREQNKYYKRYITRLENEYYELNKKCFIKDKELTIFKVDLVLNRFYLTAVVVIAIVELIILF
jgi:hypothetical protein|nr:MAG TPA: hypothetical protein [Caudoviricetes sp.]DAK40352.1 MAG TPA: hypothetical protein [Caudoviricetes sp.]DAT80041.1 MAG TPA: hypothetical protein [Caudoviricetes sp.]